MNPALTSHLFVLFELTTVVLIGLWIALDMLFFMVGGAGQTLSYSFWTWSKKYPVIPFALGFLTAHLVWQYLPV